MAGTNQTTPASPAHTAGGIVMGDEEPSTTAPDELQNTALPRERVEQFLFDLRHQPAWRKEADKACDYYDGNQLTADTVERLRDRGQPRMAHT